MGGILTNKFYNSGQSFTFIITVVNTISIEYRPCGGLLRFSLNAPSDFPSHFALPAARCLAAACYRWGSNSWSLPRGSSFSTTPSMSVEPRLSTVSPVSTFHWAIPSLLYVQKAVAHPPPHFSYCTMHVYVFPSFLWYFQPKYSDCWCGDA